MLVKKGFILNITVILRIYLQRNGLWNQKGAAQNPLHKVIKESFVSAQYFILESDLVIVMLCFRQGNIKGGSFAKLAADGYFSFMCFND